jgi:hypothetical protein
MIVSFLAWSLKPHSSWKPTSADSIPIKSHIRRRWQAAAISKWSTALAVGRVAVKIRQRSNLDRAVSGWLR